MIALWVGLAWTAGEIVGGGVMAAFSLGGRA